MKNKLLSFIVAFMMAFNLITPLASYATENTTASNETTEITTEDNYIVFDVEKFTLGLGYIQEPIIVPFEKGQTCAEILVSVLGEDNIKYTGGMSSFYLSKIKDTDDTEIEGFSKGRTLEGWLGEFDYEQTSGWMYCVNGIFPSVGMGAYKPNSSDVMRVQFTARGYGADLGSSSSWGGTSTFKAADKDKLITAIAKVNSSSDKSKLLSYKNVRLAYKNANNVMSILDSTQDEVDSALAKLNSAVDSIKDDEKAIPITGIELDKKESTVFRGEKVQLSATVSPDNATDDTTITWKSSNSEVAKVDKNGLVTAKNAGTCKIYAYAGDYRATFTITVKKDTSKIFEIEDGVLIRYNGEDTEITIPDNVKKIDEDVFKNMTNVTSITIPEGVTEIGDYAFYNCTSLTTINIPDSVTKIGNYAFGNCKKTVILKMPAELIEIGNYAFNSCSAITSMTLNDKLEKIGDHAFESTKITSLQIPTSIKSIGEYAFASCSQLAGEITLPEGLKEIPNGIFKSCSKITGINMPTAPTKIGDYAFYGCSAFTNVSIPKSVIEIGDYAFYNCSKITSLTIPENVTKIGDYAFYYLKLITSVEIPSGVTKINNRVFYGCSALETVTIPEGITEIGEYAFNGCSKLKSIKLADKTYEDEKLYDLSNITKIGQYAFYGNSLVEKIVFNDSLDTISNYVFYNCKALKSLDLPTGVKTIGKYAFYGCSEVKSIVIPDSVEILDDYVFYNMSALTDIKLPSGLKTIGSNAFAKCTAMTSLTIPKSVESIESTMASGMTKLTEIVVEEGNTNYKSVDGVLYTISGELVIYPEGKVDTELVIPEGTTKLTNTLNNKTKITKVTIPASVKEIDTNVFVGCTSLTEIVVDENNENFKTVDGVLYSKSLDTLLIYPVAKTNDEYTVLEGCTLLKDDSFKGNTNIKVLNMPLSLEAINSKAISYANNLTTVNMNEKCTKIADNAFKSCSKLTTINFPDTIESIGSYAFNSTKINSINIPSTVKEIGQNAFAGCSSLVADIVIPDGIKEIKQYTFSGCSKITSIKLPESLTTIGDSAFNGCSGLTGEIVIPNGIKEIPKYMLRNCSKITSVKLPEGLVSIGNASFYGCKLLESIDLPESVTTLGDEAFYNCSSLEEIDLPNNLEYIGVSEFYNCSKLTSITIPKTVTTIGRSSFRNCKVLSEVIIYSKNATFGNTVFGSNASDLTIRGYKKSTSEAYANENSIKFVPFDNLVEVKFEVEGQEPIEEYVLKEEKLPSAPQAMVKEGYEFVGWFKDTDDITTEFKPNSTYEENVTYKAKYAHVKMLGAQGKLVVDDKSGIRFGTKIYNDGDIIIEKGTLILPANLLEEGESLTLDTNKAAKSIGKVNYEENKEENYVTYLGTIVNIPKAQFEREITAVAYVIYKDKSGNEYTVYSQYPNKSTSVYDLLENRVDWNEKWENK